MDGKKVAKSEKVVVGGVIEVVVVVVVVMVGKDVGKESQKRRN